MVPLESLSRTSGSLIVGYRADTDSSSQNLQWARTGQAKFGVELQIAPSQLLVLRYLIQTGEKGVFNHSLLTECSQS